VPKNSNELKAKTASESRAQAKKAEKDLAEIAVAESPFAKYAGIGNPGIPSGRKGINKWLRELRGR